GLEVGDIQAAVGLFEAEADLRIAVAAGAGCGDAALDGQIGEHLAVAVAGIDGNLDFAVAVLGGHAQAAGFHGPAGPADELLPELVVVFGRGPVAVPGLARVAGECDRFAQTVLPVGEHG